jgi:transposase InsO family protein
MIDSFWDLMQAELLDRKKWNTVVELSVGMAEYIDTFHKTKRRHSALDMLTPTEYEQLHAPALQLT